MSTRPEPSDGMQRLAKIAAATVLGIAALAIGAVCAGAGALLAVFLRG